MTEAIRRYRAEVASVPKARHFVAGLLGGLQTDLSDRISIMVSELVTNVIRHAGVDFTVRVNTTPRDIRVEVTDLGGGTPSMRHPRNLEPGGRGLHIVESLADSWGVVPIFPNGKTVWFTLELAG